MIRTSNRADVLRAQLDASRPGWREELRADLDHLSPGWESFPVSLWDESISGWVDIVVLANPERISPPAQTFFSRLSRWFGK